MRNGRTLRRVSRASVLGLLGLVLGAVFLAMWWGAFSGDYELVEASRTELETEGDDVVRVDLEPNTYVAFYTYEPDPAPDSLPKGTYDTELGVLLAGTGTRKPVKEDSFTGSLDIEDGPRRARAVLSYDVPDADVYEFSGFYGTFGSAGRGLILGRERARPAWQLALGVLLGGAGIAGLASPRRSRRGTS